MKTRKQQWERAARALGAGSIALLITIAAAWRAGSTAPALSIALTGTNQVTVTVTNGAPTGIYEIWWTEFLDADAMSLTNGAWADKYPGTLGQTNFVFDLGETWTGFFRAVNTNDFDGDGIVNYQDARPFDPSVGILRVTIESPANGSNVQ